MDKPADEVIVAIGKACEEYQAKYGLKEIPLELEIGRKSILDVAEYIRAHPNLGRVYGNAFRCGVITTIDVVVKNSQQAVELVNACYNGSPMRNIKDIRFTPHFEEFD